MRRYLWLAGLVTVLVACGSPKAGVSPNLEVIATTPEPPAGAMVNENPTRWIVELSGAPTSDGVSLQSVQAQQEVFKQAAQAAGVKINLSYTNLINGFSVEYTGNPNKLYTLPGVVAIYPVRLISIPESRPIEPDLANAITQTGVDIAQNDLGLSGKGVKVGIIDTGIDLQHPAFAGRVVKGYDFVGDAYNASDPANSTPIPDNNPDDCNGHGTHVAGIVGGKDTQITGVAPGVKFGAYKVFGCAGSVGDDIVLAALERAETDGMDIVNMSLGSPFGWSALVRGINQISKRGVVVVASAGNDGTLGLFAAGSPAAATSAISVASFDNIRVQANKAIANPGGAAIGYLPLGGAAEPPTSGTSAEVVYIGRGCLSDTYAANPSGKVALIDRGACTFNEKYQRAVGAGAVGVVVANNNSGIFAGGGIAPKSVFGIGISREDGLALRALTAPTLTWTSELINVNLATANLISSFSSWGLSQDLESKPDLGAPGGLIRSALPLEQGGYGVLSGTSMSAPHVAGAAALILEGNPAFWGIQRPSLMKAILQNTAQPKAFSLAPTAGIPEASFREGAGMIDVVGAVQTRVVATPSVISFAKVAGSFTQTITLKNRSTVPTIYQLRHLPGVSATGSVYSPGFVTGFANVSFSANQITVPARGEVKVDVTISPNSALPSKSLYGGYILFEPLGAGVALNVPYTGLQGGYQSIKVLTPTAYGFPWLSNANYDNLTGGGSFTLQGTDMPSILFHFEHGARVYQVTILNAQTNQPIYPKFNKADYAVYTSRNSSANGFYSLTWDGTRITAYNSVDYYGTSVKVPGEFKPIPNGQYKLKLEVLKPTGNENNPADWESWTSPVITIARP